METGLEASQSGSGFTFSLAQQETGCVSVSVPVLGKFAHSSARAVAKLDVTIKHSLTEVGLDLTMELLSAMVTIKRC